MRLVYRATSVLILALLAACPGGEAPAGPATARDGGSVTGDGGASGVDAGRPRIAWPQPTLVVPDATEPGLALSPDGHVTLVYLKQGKVWAYRDPPAGEPFELGAAPSSQTELRIFASPSADRAFVAWTGRSGVGLTAGVADGAPRLLLGGDADLYTLGGGWLGERPAIIARTGELWYGSERVPGKHLAFTVPIDSPETLPLPEPRDSELLATDINPFHLSDESETLLDLGDGRGLMFDRWTENPPGDTTVRNLARWRLLARGPLASGARADYLTGRSGTLVLPGGPGSWLRAFALGEGKFALAWGAAPDTLVFDVFLAGFELDENGEPRLTTGALNLSMTTGATDNSDFPLVAPAGDGRFWVAWREDTFGPRVALLSADFKLLAIGAPDEELGCSLSSALGAVADAEGTLHLAAGFLEEVDDQGVLVMRYYRIALP